MGDKGLAISTTIIAIVLLLLLLLVSWLLKLAFFLKGFIGLGSQVCRASILGKGYTGVCYKYA